MDRNEQEYNKHSNQKETERILKRRDREKYLELGGLQIANLDEFLSNIKWAAVVMVIAFTISSLTLLYYLWRVASLKRQIAEIGKKVYRLDRDLLK